MSEANLISESKSWLKDRLSSQSCQYPLKYVSPIMTAFHREILFKWVFDLCYDLNTSLKTPYLSCHLIDKFLTLKPVPSYEILELVSLVCVSISLKYVESSNIQTSQLENYLNNKFSSVIFTETERYVLGQLNWRLECMTVYDIIEEIVPAGMGNREKIVFTAASFGILLISDQRCMDLGIETIALAVLQKTLNYFKVESNLLHLFEDLVNAKEKICELVSVLNLKIENIKGEEV
jgi:hypothetical protein